MKLQKKHTKYLQGFTLIEALVAISILIIGIISAFILIVKVLYNTTVIQDRLTASFLAQEGLELTRQIRDSNYLKMIYDRSIVWDDGLKNNPYPCTYRIYYDTLPGGEVKVILDSNNPDSFLYYHYDTGLFNYNSIGGEPTSFVRELTLDKKISSDPEEGDQEIIATVIVTWKSKGLNYKIVVEDHLFNWLP